MFKALVTHAFHNAMFIFHIKVAETIDVGQGRETNDAKFAYGKIVSCSRKYSTHTPANPFFLSSGPQKKRILTNENE